MVVVHWCGAKNMLNVICFALVLVGTLGQNYPDYECSSNDDCSAGLECADGLCQFRMDCPMPMLVAPGPDCTYTNRIDENGCPLPHLECNCTENEEISMCQPCEGTCGVRGQPCTINCRHMAECACKEGFYRNNNGQCVTEAECDANEKCGENEELKTCGACDGTCEEKMPACTRDCRPAECGCKLGFVRNDGVCVPEFVCEHKNETCGANEEFLECGTACEPSCDNPNPSFCTYQCIVNVCQCKQGFYRDDNGQCVEKMGCPQKKNGTCGMNEELLECGSACEPTCDSPNPLSCTEQCLLDVCQCKQGFYRASDGTCVKEMECARDKTMQIIQGVSEFLPHFKLATETQCPENETFKECGVSCEPSCDNPNPMICTANCIVNVCQCEQDFYRNQSGTCVSLDQCA